MEPFAYLSTEDVNTLSKSITREEIEFAVKNVNPNKAPEPDGLNAYFYKVCWPIIGADICDVIRDFFQSGLMLNQLNVTFIVLVPKGDNNISPDKYMPISLTNELYKIITQVLMAYLKHLMGKLIGPMQLTFIPGRTISNNILNAQNLLDKFLLTYGAPRMCLKLDHAKACDSIC